MELTSAHLTPEHQGLLHALAEETGKDAQTLLDEALEGFRDRVRPDLTPRETSGEDAQEAAAPSTDLRRPIWEKICEAFNHVPEDALASLPVDGAAHVDHYAYGLPKR
jgi:hypothetical protein